MELATAVAGQIARTAAIFKIDEVIVIDDAADREPGTIGAGAAFLARVLQFMETPQYLRRCFFLIGLLQLSSLLASCRQCMTATTNDACTSASTHTHTSTLGVARHAAVSRCHVMQSLDPHAR